MNGILVAITVMNSTLASKGRLAMKTTARATCSTSILGSTSIVPLACMTLGRGVSDVDLAARDVVLPPIQGC